jgi:hypothetical protein
VNETQFNAELRAIMRVQGLGVLHIREADQPGASDLVVWQGLRPTSVWVELKVGEHTVEPHQWQFLEDRVREGFDCFTVTLSTNPNDPYGVHIGRVIGRGHKCYYVGYKSDYRRVDWSEILFHKIAEQS